MRKTSLRALLLLLWVAGCGSQVSTESADEVDTDDDPGERPSEPGQSYSACGDPDECLPMPYCVFPQGEAGFCTQACGSGDDASTCALDPGTTDRVFCLDIGLPDGRTVCALDCADGFPCPEGMRCEGIDTDAGPQQVCF